jgi:hypothetical protein
MNNDPDLYEFIRNIFQCDNTYLNKCKSNRGKLKTSISNFILK